MPWYTETPLSSRKGLLYIFDMGNCLLRRRALVPKIMRIAQKNNPGINFHHVGLLENAMYKVKLEQRDIEPPPKNEDDIALRIKRELNKWHRLVYALHSSSKNDGVGSLLPMNDELFWTEMRTLVQNEYTHYPSSSALSDDATQMLSLLRQKKRDAMAGADQQYEDVCLAIETFPARTGISAETQRAMSFDFLNKAGLSYDPTRLDFGTSAAEKIVDVDFILPSLETRADELPAFYKDPTGAIARVIQSRLASNRKLSRGIHYNVVFISRIPAVSFPAALSGMHHVLFLNRRYASWFRKHKNTYIGSMITSATKVLQWQRQPLPLSQVMWKIWQNSTRKHKPEYVAKYKHVEDLIKQRAGIP